MVEVQASLDCRNTRRFSIDAFSMVGAPQISVRILLLDLTEHPPLDAYMALYTNAFLRCGIIATEFRDEILSPQTLTLHMYKRYWSIRPG